MKTRPIVLFFVYCFSAWLIFSLIGCGGGGSSSPQTTPQKASISGMVSGSGPLEDVAVFCGDDTDTTDSDGFFIFPEVTVPDNGRLVLTFEKPGYATFQRSIYTEDGGSYFTTALLSTYNLSEDYPPDEEVALSYIPIGEDEPLLDLLIPANAIQGAAVGDVEVSVVYGDPTSEEGRTAFPGDYMAASAAGMEPDTPLVSVAFAEVTLTDSEGSELNGDLAEPATLTLRLPEKYQPGQPQEDTYKAGDGIEWWSYDETTAAWIQEDADPSTPEMDMAEVVSGAGGLLYVRGKAGHFTWWNADHPLTTHACYCVDILNHEDKPLSGVGVVSVGENYAGTFSAGQPLGDNNLEGLACTNVMLNIEGNTTWQSTLYAELGMLRFPYDVTSEAEGYPETDVLKNPYTQGSTLDGDIGDCIKLENPIRLAFLGQVHGTVTEEDTGEPVPGVTVVATSGLTINAVTDSEGEYVFAYVPTGEEYVVRVGGKGLKCVGCPENEAWAEVTLEPEEVRSVNFIRLNADPIITHFSRNPSTPTATQVVFSARAMDPDGDPITYSWSAAAGSPASGSGSMVEGWNKFTWTSPSTAQTVDVTLTVEDDRGGSTSNTVSVVVEESAGDDLMVTVLDAGDQAVEGAHVVLHGADNVSIEQSAITGSGGSVSFGDVGRQRVSLTVGALVGGDRRLYTALEVLAGHIVVYIREDDPYSCTSVNTTTATLSGSTTIRMAKVLPSGRSGQSQFPTTGITIPMVPVCAEHLQAADGLLSLLGVGFATLAPIPSVYGYLLDESPNDESYSVPLDRTPSDVEWTISPATSDYVTVAFTGMRDGVSYSLANGGNDQSAGTVKYPLDFPVDYHQISATTYGPPALTSLTKNPDAMESLVTLVLPDYQLDGFVFNEAGNGSFSWALGGSSAKDAIVLDAEFWVAYESTEWSVLIPPGSTSWVVPDLPAALEPWIAMDTSNGDSGSIYLTVYDFDSVEGIDELFELYNSGTDPWTASDNMFSAMVSVYLGEDPYYTSELLDHDESKTTGFSFSRILDSFKRK